MGTASQKLVKRFMAQQATKLKYNSEAVVGAKEDLKDVFI